MRWRKRNSLCERHVLRYFVVALRSSRNRGNAMKHMVIVTTIAAHASQILLGILATNDIRAAIITDNVLIESPVK